MKHENLMFLRGPITEVRFHDGKVYGFMNFVVGSHNIPVSVSYGGQDYSGDKLANTHQKVSSSPHYLIVGGAKIKESKYEKGGYVIDARPKEIQVLPYEISEGSYAHFRGRVEEVSPDQEGKVWARVAQSYRSKNPRTGETKFATREAKVLLDRQWEPNIVGKKMVVDGFLYGLLGKDRMLYIAAANTSLFD